MQIIMKPVHILFCCLFLLTNCRKLEVATPDFNVSLPATTYKVGDTLRFAFSGRADNVVFYSGEPGFNYQFRDRSSAEGIPQLDFTSYLQNKGQLNTLKLLLSTDFNGNYDSAGIQQATWSDLTDKAILSTGTDNTPSGPIDLSDYAKQNKPVYFAFRYQGYYSDVLKQPAWSVRTFNISNLTPDGKRSSIAINREIGWAAVDFKNPTVTWAVPVSGQVTINGTIANSTKEENDDWIVSRPFDLRSVTPDAGVSVMDLGSALIDEYTYIYNRPGTYKVTFVAFNHSVDEHRELVREMEITITP
jgi:hypothetical protein